MNSGKERFEKVYLNLPDAEKKLVIVIIGEQRITWNQAHAEIKKNTEIGRSIIDKLVREEII